MAKPPGINQIERIFQRYLSNPARQWTEAATPPYILASNDTLGGLNEINQDEAPVIIRIDIEDVQYNRVRTLASSHMVSKTYRMFIRASLEDNTNNPELDFRLKNVTDDICGFLGEDRDMMVAKEVYVDRAMGVNNPSIVQLNRNDDPIEPIPIFIGDLSSDPIFNEPLPVYISGKERIAINGLGIEGEFHENTQFPYNEYILEERGSGVLADQTPTQLIDYNYNLIQPNVERVYGFVFELKRPKFMAVRSNLVSGSLNNLSVPVVSWYLLPLNIGDTTGPTYDLDMDFKYLIERDTDVVKDNVYLGELGPDFPQDFINDSQLVNIKPGNINYELINTFYTIIDVDPVDITGPARELRNETLVQVTEAL